MCCGTSLEQIETWPSLLHDYGAAQNQGELMFFKKQQKRSVREPDETVRLSESIEAVLWKEKRKDGALDIRFGLNRIDAQGNVRRTFSPMHLAELAEGIAALSVAIGQSPGIEQNLATGLKELGTGIVKVLESLRSNGPDSTEESRPARLFA